MINHLHKEIYFKFELNACNAELECVPLKAKSARFKQDQTLNIRYKNQKYLRQNNYGSFTISINCEETKAD